MFFPSAARLGRLPREIVWAVAKGMYGRSKRCYRLAHRRVMKELDHMYFLRHRRPHDMRTLWITRINPAGREHGLGYSRFTSGLKRGDIHLDRKALCAIAETEPVTFKVLVDEAKRIMYPKKLGEERDLSRF
mmetsp:Transcript_4310/g.6087  ORF Transcript_4310/g.6087 Transcript_4310/m.6087 type:complete len:132 (-) Transcript_4310:104-499(-)